MRERLPSCPQAACGRVLSQPSRKQTRSGPLRASHNHHGVAAPRRGRGPTNHARRCVTSGRQHHTGRDSCYADSTAATPSRGTIVRGRSGPRLPRPVVRCPDGRTGHATARPTTPSAWHDRPWPQRATATWSRCALPRRANRPCRQHGPPRPRHGTIVRGRSGPRLPCPFVCRGLVGGHPQGTESPGAPPRPRSRERENPYPGG